jgi:hypothetical protein
VFAPAASSARDVSLGYDATLLAPTIEKMDVTDDWLVARWGKTLYRVLLTSIGSTDSGKWAIEFS